MSYRLTFSLASLIVLIALGFIATPAMAAEFADSADISDVSVVQGQKIDITFPTATSTEPAGDDPATDPAGVMSATLTPTGQGAVSPSAADPPVAETSGTLQGLTFTFNATTGVGKLTGNASPNEVTRILVTYTIAETDGGDADSDPADPASLVFAFEVRPQTDMLTFRNASISDKELTVGNYFYEVLPAAQDGIGPLTYSIAGVTTETPANSGIFTGGDLPAGLTFVPATRVLSGTPSAADPRAVLTYTVTDSTATTADTETISFTIEVKARVNGPMFAAGMTKVPDAAYTEGHAIEEMTLPEADTTNALGSVTYALTGLPTGTGLSFDAATRMLTGTPSDKDQAASPIAAMYTAEDQSGNDAELSFKITVNDMVSVTAPGNVTDHVLGKQFTDITIPPVSGGTGDSTVEVTGLPAGLMLDGMKITGNPTAMGSTTVTITATDTLGAMGTKDFMITVEKAPAITFESVVAPQTYTVGTPITPMLLPVGSGGIGTLSYALDNLPGGITFDPTTRLLRGTPSTEMATADYNYVITDSAFGHIPAASRTADHKANSIMLPISITVKAAPTVTNSAPDFGTQTIANIDATAGTAISGMFLPEATDADGDTLVYSLSPALPTGLTFNSTNRALTGTPTAVITQTAYTYKVEDGNGGMDTIGFFITVNVAPRTPPATNMPPAFAEDAKIDNIVATAGMAIDGVVLPEAMDSDGDTVNYSISPAPPSGLVFNRAARTLTGTPTAAMAQTAYTYMASDGRGGSDTIPFFITVSAAPNVAPEYADTTPIEIMGTAGMAITPVSAAATDANGDALTYSWDVDETALGLMLNTSTGMITGTPNKAHTGSHPVTATDPGGLTATRGVNVTIVAGSPTNVAPVVTITTTAPTEPQMNSFVIAYTATDANAGDTPSVVVTRTISPDTATGYTVDRSTDGMVTITQAAGSPIAVVKVTITATDPRDSSLSDSASISVTFAALAEEVPDTVPPTVTVTAPTAPDTDGNLVFTFVFSEPIQPSTFTAADIAGEDYIVTAAPTMDDTDTTMKTWTAKVKPTGDDDVTVVINVEAVMDMAGNANVVGHFAKYTPPTAPAAPAGLTATPAVGSVTFTWTAVAGAMYEYSTDGGTTWMAVATSGTQTVSSTTAVTFMVRVKASGSIPVGIAATLIGTPTAPAAPTDTPNMLTSLSVPAESYVVLVRNKATVKGLPASVTDAQKIGWAGMPDLEALFVSGGSLALTRNKTPQIDGRDAKVRDLVITEVMWARNLAVVGQAGEMDHQWIEIYNPLKVAVSGVTVTTKARRPALTSTGNEVQLDMLSNIVGSGWAFDIGQNGYHDATNAEAGRIEFVSMYRNNRAGDKHGWVKGHWSASSETYLPNYKGTPGKGERKGVQTVATTSFNVGPVIFNEVSNRSSGTYEWFELRNKSDSEQNLKNREIRIVKDVGSDVSLFQFGDQNATIPAKGVLLCVFTDPRNDPNHPIATGWNIDLGAADQINGVGDHSPRYIVVNDHGKRVYNEAALGDEGLPAEFVLILRSRRHNDDIGKDTNIWDIAGYDTSLKIGAAEAGFTNLWPLKGAVRNAQLSNNKWDVGTVHRRQKDNVWGTSSTNYGRNGGNHADDTAWRNVGWTGIGYRRNAAANNENGGTPGYDNGVLKSRETTSGTADANVPVVIITEVMYATGNRANLPQWIELYNPSKTHGINMDGWRVTIVNHDLDADGEPYAGDLSKNYAINGKIPPGQTYLLTAYSARNDTNLPSERIHFLRGNKRGELIFSQYGFEITLLTYGKDNKDANRKVVDKVGNLAIITGPGRVRTNPQSYEDPAWALPMSTNEDGNRVSIVRVSIGDDPIDGQRQGAWKLFDMSEQFVKTLEETDYGHGSDEGSPGHTVGGVLPVSLSKFRPERLDTGEVIVRWITESELDNAGFNILRSETEDGEFTKLNTELIAGKGTTSEQTTYDFVDKSAKPNVVYYYQIQDVSLDGDVTTLRTTHLRGHVSATGKLTTTWGELKALQ